MQLGKSQPRATLEDEQVPHIHQVSVQLTRVPRPHWCGTGCSPSTLAPIKVPRREEKKSTRANRGIGAFTFISRVTALRLRVSLAGLFRGKLKALTLQHSWAVTREIGAKKCWRPTQHTWAIWHARTNSLRAVHSTKAAERLGRYGWG